MGLLVEDDSYPIQWNSKVRDVLPEGEWVLQDKFTQEYANIIDILAHHSGLPRHDLSYSRADTAKSVVYKPIEARETNAHIVAHIPRSRSYDIYVPRPNSVRCEFTAASYCTPG